MILSAFKADKECLSKPRASGDDPTRGLIEAITTK